MTDTPAHAKGEPEHVRRNRDGWNATSEEYEAEHASQLDQTPMSWGQWSIPEKELGILGSVDGLDILELGCGAARWSIALAGSGGRPVGMDLSEGQLAQARRQLSRSESRVPLVQASAERLPFGPGSFDLVFCDHGAMNFADPTVVVPEVARALRPGGLFAFSVPSPIRQICYDRDTDETGTELKLDYFETRRMEWDDEVDFHLPYGEWAALFLANGLSIEGLIEPRPPEGAPTTYGVPTEWGRRWPCETIWRVRKPA